MLSTKEKFLLTLAISDEGIEMMLQRIRRNNPNVDKDLHKRLLFEEMSKHKTKSLPSYLKPVY